MKAEEFCREFNDWWQATTTQATGDKNSQDALFKLIELYRGLRASERSLLEPLFCEWIGSDDETKRFDALAMVGEFKIHACLPELKRYRAKLWATAAAPDTPYELAKVQRILERLGDDENGVGGEKRTNGVGSSK